MIQLYDYQTDIINKLRTALSEGKKRIIIQSPTGSGKTVIFSYLVAEMKKRAKRALIITNRIELLTETGGTLQEFGLQPYNILAGQIVQPPMQYQVYIAMSQTLRRRIGTWPAFWKSFDVVIMDEVHLQEFNPYFEFDAFPQRTIILGFSATPTRSGKMRQLGDDFEMMIEGLQVPELVKRGRLVRDYYYGVGGVDMSGVRLNSLGDYKENQMFAKFNRPELYKGVIENYEKHTPGTMALCFCVNIQHVIETCKAFNEAGISAKFLVSGVSRPQLPGDPTAGQQVRHERKEKEYDNYIDAIQKYSGERHKLVSDWKLRKFKVLVNAGILTTGFNVKQIETVIMNRATVSVPLWLQIIGRGSRVFPEKTYFNILDFGGNGSRLGYYMQERQWSLWHEKSKGEGAMPVKECGDVMKPITDENGRTGCGAYIFAGHDICPYCGYLFPKKKNEKFADLVKIDYIDSPLLNNQTDSELFFDELERRAESRGYKVGWVLNQIIVKLGEQGLKDYGESRKYKGSWFWMTKKRYQGAIDKFNEKQEQELQQKKQQENEHTI